MMRFQVLDWPCDQSSFLVHMLTPPFLFAQSHLNDHSTRISGHFFSYEQICRMHDTHFKIYMSFNTRNSCSANIYVKNEIRETDVTLLQMVQVSRSSDYNAGGLKAQDLSVLHRCKM